MSWVHQAFIATPRRLGLVGPLMMETNQCNELILRPIFPRPSLVKSLLYKCTPLQTFLKIYVLGVIHIMNLYAVHIRIGNTIRIGNEDNA